MQMPKAPAADVATRLPRRFTGVVPVLIFLARRLVFGALTLLGTSLLGYGLAAHMERVGGGVIGRRPYLSWLRDAIQGDLGNGSLGWVSPQMPITELLAEAIPNTLWLIGGAALIAITLGVTAGIIAALRQYSHIDYWLAALAYVLFSVPPFVAAYMMQLFGIIQFNDHFQNFATTRAIPWFPLAIVSLISGFIWSEILGGNSRKKQTTFAIAIIATFVVGVTVTATGWILQPRLGMIGIGIASVGIAFGVVALISRMGDRRTLRAAIIAAGFATIAWYPLQFAFASPAISWPMLVLILLVALGCGLLIGILNGGEWGERLIAMRAAATTTFLTTALIIVDRFMAIWPHYLNHRSVNNRPFIVLHRRWGLPEDFWFTTLDTWMFLLPATLALGLISFAAYLRYTRASLSEVLNQEYIRSARAKGLPEHIVLFRHAIRNSLIPLATILPLDLAGLIGGAILVEHIFSIPGMGTFYRGLLYYSPELRQGFMQFDSFMSYLLITGAFLIIANIISDLIYAALDPRIRLSLHTR